MQNFILSLTVKNTGRFWHETKASLERGYGVPPELGK